MKRAIRAALLAAALLVGVHAPPAHAASVWYANSIYSERNLSVGTTDPVTSGNIYRLAPGGGRYGKAFYAPAGCLTRFSSGGLWYWAFPGMWNYRPSTGSSAVIIDC